MKQLICLSTPEDIQPFRGRADNGCADRGVVDGPLLEHRKPRALEGNRDFQ